MVVASLYNVRSWNGAPWKYSDLVKAENGRITDNWHLEDNLTFLRQMGVADVASWRLAKGQTTGSRRWVLVVCERPPCCDLLGTHPLMRRLVNTWSRLSPIARPSAFSSLSHRG